MQKLDNGVPERSICMKSLLSENNSSVKYLKNDPKILINHKSNEHLEIATTRSKILNPSTSFAKNNKGKSFTSLTYFDMLSDSIII